MNENTFEVIDTSIVSKLEQDVGAEMVPTLLAMYVQELEEYLHGLTVSGSSDLPSVAALAHKAKNSAALFGAPRIASYSIRLEEEANQEGENIDITLKDTVSTIEVTLTEMRELYANLSVG